MSGAPRVTAHVREEVKILQRLGWAYARHDSRSHPVYTHDLYGEITVPNTPKRGGGWKHHLRRTVAARMSLSVPEFEALIAGQKTVGKRTVRRKKPGRERPVPLRLVKPEAPPLSKPAPDPEPQVAYLPTDPRTPERAAMWRDLQKANLAARSRERLEHPFRELDSTRRSAE